MNSRERATATGPTRQKRFFGGLALFAVPGSIFSAAATAPMGLVALYGLAIRLAGNRADPDVAALFRVLGTCYLALLATDFLNGGSIANLQFTAVNYLPLVGAVGVSHVLRRSAIRDDHVVAVLGAAIWIAVASSLLQFLVLDVGRPGGISINPIPFSLVISLWGMLLLSFSLGGARPPWPLLITALAAVVPILLAGSKLVWITAFVGYAVVVGRWAIMGRRWRELGLAAAGALLVASVGFATVAQPRIDQFVTEISAFISTGDRSGASFGYRAILAEAGFLAFLDGPFLGYGFAEHRDAALAFAPAGTPPDALQLTHLHNDFVTHLVAYGYVGLIFLVVFFGTLIWIARNAADPARRSAGYALAAMIFVYMAGEIFFNIEAITGPFAIMVGILMMRPPAQQS